MKTILFLMLPLILVYAIQDQTSLSENSSLQVLSSKWARTRKVSEKPPEEATAPARQVIPQNKNFQRNARINDPQGVRDPNLDTLDGRSAAMEKSVQDSRADQPKSSEGFSYKIKVQNAAQKSVEIVFWEYQFVDTSNINAMARRQFLCGVSIGPNKTKELEGFSFSGPSDVVSVNTLNNQNPLQEKAIINRVEYSDGSIWQRKGWHIAEVKASYQRALNEPWVVGQCKLL